MGTPNVLWIMTDEQRIDSLGTYGSRWACTPRLDALMRDGVTFGRAITPAPVCIPARTSILTGQYPSELGVWWNLQDSRVVPHLTDRFAEAGYRTASFGKQHYCSGNSAFQTEQGPAISPRVGPFAYHPDYPEIDYDVIRYPASPYGWIFGGRFPGTIDKTPESLTVKNAMAWLDAHRTFTKDSPFLLRLSFNAPHTPVVPPRPFERLISEIHYPDAAEMDHTTNGPTWLATDLARISTAKRLTSTQIQRMREYYYGQVAHVDYQCEVLLEYLQEADLLQNTIVVMVADHGTHLGDYGLVQKQTFFEPVVTVPFFFWYPERFGKGWFYQTPVETRCLLPTLLEAVGLESEPVQGGSVYASLVNQAEPEIHPVFSEFTLGSFDVRRAERLVMVREGDWKLSVRYPDNANDEHCTDETLFDLQFDPCETRNVWDTPKHYRQGERLRCLIDAHIRKSRQVGRKIGRD